MNKEEKAAYDKARYQANKSSDYYQANKERIKAQSAAYYMENKEKVLGKAREYHEAHKDERAAYNKAYRLSNPERFKERQRVSYFANREKAKKTAAAYRLANREIVKENLRAYYLANSEKAKENRAAHYLANKEKAAAYRSAYQKANPEKVKILNHKRRALKRQSGGALSIALTEKLFKLQKGKCPCCRLPLGKDFHLDHILPLALGGSNTDDNIQLLRAKCNMQKSAKHPVDFMQSRGFLL